MADRGAAAVNCASATCNEGKVSAVWNRVASRIVHPLAGAVVLFALAGWAGVARAAESYIVMSLIGDRITIVSAGPVTGTHLDANTYEVVRLPGAGFDDWVANVTEGAVRRARPGAQVTMLRVSDRSIYGIGSTGDEANVPSLQTLVANVAKHVPAVPDSRVVLVAPLRAEPELLAYEGYLGHGNVAGLGFYVGFMPINRSWLTGFLGTFANFQLVLYDPRSERIEARERITVGNAVSAAESPDGSAWNALSPERKDAALQALLQAEIERRIPALLAARGP
jgi:hypothetical protein